MSIVTAPPGWWWIYSDESGPYMLRIAAWEHWYGHAYDEDDPDPTDKRLKSTPLTVNRAGQLERLTIDPKRNFLGVHHESDLNPDMFAPSKSEPRIGVAHFHAAAEAHRRRMKEEKAKR